MRKTKEVLRLRFEWGLGQRQIARCCGMGLGTVHEYLERATAAGIGWPLPEGLSEEELEAKLFENQPIRAKAVEQRPQPDWKTIHEQLQQHRHLTLQLVWEEYRQANPERMSNQEWKSPADADARITKRKDGSTHLAHKAEHAVDLDTGAVAGGHVTRR